MSDIFDKATAMGQDALSKAKESGALDKAEELAEAQAEKGGTLGGLADKADDAIDMVQGTKD